MNHHTGKLSQLRIASTDESFAPRSAVRSGPAVIEPKARSASLAMSIMVALRYLEGRPRHRAAASDPVLS